MQPNLNSRVIRYHNARYMGGFALGEMLLAVAIAAVLAAVGFGIYRSLSSDTNVQDFTQKSVSMLGKIKSVYGTGTYAGISGQAIDQLGARPDSFRYDGTNLIDNFGNTVTVAGSATFYGMKFEGISKDNCSRMASALAGVSAVVNVGTAAAVTVPAGVPTGGSVYKALGGQPDPSALATGCGAAEPLAIAVQVR